MKAKFPTLIPFSLLLLLPIAAQAGWKRLSDSDLRSYSKNLARHHMGASLSLTGQASNGAVLLSLDDVDQNRSADSLLVEDPTIGFPLQAGESSVVIQLPEIEILQSLAFANEGGAGRVSVSTAITRNAVEEGRWQDASFAAFDEEKRSVSVELSGIDAKYVRITWNTSAPGRIHNFGIFGEPRADEFEIKKVGGEHVAFDNQDLVASVDYNLLSVYSGSRIAYVSSGTGDATALVDGDSSTSYSFNSSDEFPTVVVELGSDVPVSRATALYDQKAAKLAVYALGNLPESTDWVGRTSFEEDVLEDFTPVGLAADNDAIGRLAVDFAAATSRFVVFQFAPASPEGEDFSVVDLAAFSDEVGPGHLVARSVWHAKSVDKQVEYDLQSRTRLLSYAGPLAGLSGANYLRRGSGGIGGGFPGGRGALAARDREIEELRRELLDASDERAPRGGSTHEVVVTNTVTNTVFVPVPDDDTTVEERVFAPVLQVVSRIAVSATTVPGVGHLYFNAGAGEAPPGYTFVSPAFEGTHEGGVIQPEVVGQITVPASSESTAVVAGTVGTSFLPVTAE